MRTYAEYLTSLTVKTLHTIAKQGGYKGYSKLRKAELVAFIEGESVIDWDGALAKLATDFTAKQSAPAVTFSEAPVSTEIKHGELWDCCKARPAKVIVFDNGARHAVCAACASRYTGEVQDLPTQTPVAPVESAPEATAKQTPSTGTPEDTDTAELVYAYRQMRATIKNMGNTPGRVKIVGRLRLISAQLKAQGMRPACL